MSQCFNWTIMCSYLNLMEQNMKGLSFKLSLMIQKIKDRPTHITTVLSLDWTLCNLTYVQFAGNCGN